jgi:hypothetical protein
VIEALRQAHRAVEDALARGDPALDAELLAKLRQRYDEAVAFGVTHNRHRDWHDGNHPGYALGCWLRDYKDQVWLFTANLAVDWTNNCSEQALKAAKRHQAVVGYWHTNRTLARWCRIRSYLDSTASHGPTALDAITRASPATLGAQRQPPQPRPETAAHHQSLNGHPNMLFAAVATPRNKQWRSGGAYSFEKLVSREREVVRVRACHAALTAGWRAGVVVRCA